MEAVLDKAIDDIRHEKPKRHATLTAILQEEPALTDYYIVGMIRNPWARMVSWWSMVQDDAERAKDGHKAALRRFSRLPVWIQLSKYPDFDTFIRKGPEDMNRFREPQISRLETPTRRADYIGHTETLDKDIAAILGHLGLEVPAELPHRNKSTHDSYRKFYTPATRDRVAELYARDIEEFGYEF